MKRYTIKRCYERKLLNDDEQLGYFYRTYYSLYSEDGVWQGWGHTEDECVDQILSANNIDIDWDYEEKPND